MVNLYYVGMVIIKDIINYVYCSSMSESLMYLRILVGFINKGRENIILVLVIWELSHHDLHLWRFSPKVVNNLHTLMWCNLHNSICFKIWGCPCLMFIGKPSIVKTEIYVGWCYHMSMHLHRTPIYKSNLQVQMHI